MSIYHENIDRAVEMATEYELLSNISAQLDWAVSGNPLREIDATLLGASQLIDKGLAKLEEWRSYYLDAAKDIVDQLQQETDKGGTTMKNSIDQQQVADARDQDKLALALITPYTARLEHLMHELQDIDEALALSSNKEVQLASNKTIASLHDLRGAIHILTNEEQRIKVANQLRDDWLEEEGYND